MIVDYAKFQKKVLIVEQFLISGIRFFSQQVNYDAILHFLLLG